LPAGAYAVLADGYTQATDAKVHADLIYRPAGGADKILGGVDSTPQPASFHLQPWVQGNICGTALAASAGDALVLELTYISGSSPFTVLQTHLTIP
jgi:hypothetical protein